MIRQVIRVDIDLDLQNHIKLCQRCQKDYTTMMLYGSKIAEHLGDVSE